MDLLFQIGSGWNLAGLFMHNYASSYFQDHDIISCRKMLPSVVCTCVQQHQLVVYSSWFVVHSYLFLLIYKCWLYVLCRQRSQHVYYSSWLFVLFRRSWWETTWSSLQKCVRIWRENIARSCRSYGIRMKVGIAVFVAQCYLHSAVVTQTQRHLAVSYKK